MTNELEKQFFDTFGIEPKIDYLCPKCNVPMYKVWRSDGCGYTCSHQTHTEELKHETEMENYKKAYRYPQINDRILLELICIHNTYLEANLYSLDYESLKKEILKDLINEQESRELKKDYISDDFKHQVRTLFEEER